MEAFVRLELLVGQQQKQTNTKQNPQPEKGAIILCGDKFSTLSE